jgi:hypothetical protein
MLETIRRELGNMNDRRRAPRMAVDYAMVVHPLHSDGTAEPARAARCRDVSSSGVSFTVAEPIKTRYAYVEFTGVTGVTGLAILMKLLRTQAPPALGGEYLYAGPFKFDL